MKNLIKRLPESIISYLDNEVPFMEMRISDTAWLKMYWTRNKGSYGYQVIGVYCNYDKWCYFKTNGCGYSKKNECLHRLFRLSETKIKGLRDHNQYDDAYNNYRVGGNFHKVPKSALRKFKR